MAWRRCLPNRSRFVNCYSSFPFQTAWLTHRLQPPAHRHPRHAIEIPAIEEPHPGTSYNPHIDAHKELILKAHEIEEKRLKDTEKFAAVKSKIEMARQNQEDAVGVVAGMKLDINTAEDEVNEPESEMALPKKMPERKTKQQRSKAKRVLAEVIVPFSLRVM